MNGGKILPPQGDGFGILPGRMILAGVYKLDGEERLVGPTARTLYAVLWYHRVMSAEFPSVEDLAFQCGVDAKVTVLNALNELEVAKFLLVVRSPGRRNDYKLLDGRGATVEVAAEIHASELASRRKAKKKPEEKPEATGQKEIIELWERLFLDRFGFKYNFAGGRDALAAAGLARIFTDKAELSKLICSTWNNSDFMADRYLGGRIVTIHGFLAELNRLRAAQPQGSPSPATYKRTAS